jgi:hypothetical protein
VVLGARSGKRIKWFPTAVSKGPSHSSRSGLVTLAVPDGTLPEIPQRFRKRRLIASGRVGTGIAVLARPPRHVPTPWAPAHGDRDRPSRTPAVRLGVPASASSWRPPGWTQAVILSHSESF